MHVKLLCEELVRKVNNATVYIAILRVSNE